ncbi:MAG TPA: D-glycero-beta-D-manno-heptose-7-phosphate kinase [Stellaceae bacterium]|nr:D-glycero-beta-D-manno-heptose-7-phosphate kinase [Stellaceae bacterium]
MPAENSLAPGPPGAAALDFAGLGVIVLGDVMLDTWIDGHVERISPEAPIPVLRIDRRREMLGGAGNVARNIAALGGRAILIGVVGKDDPGRKVLRLAGEAGPRPGQVAARLVMSKNSPTTHKTRYVAAGQQILRVDEEVASPVVGAPAARLIATFEAALAEAAAVVISDYAKGTLAPAVLERAIAAARAAGKPVIVDPKARDMSRYRGVTMLTPNRAEAYAATGIDCAEAESAERAGRELILAAAAEAALITRGASGLSLIPRDGPALHVPSRARDVFDVSGAGDTLVAALALALAAGAPLVLAAHVANAAAGVVVGKPGTATLSPRELAAALHEEETQEITAKIVGLDEALERVAGWRAAGQRIGFTNGCFDLIHPGHVRLLSKARAECDRLVVGLNSDASVRRLKGPERPVQNETARATVMASIGSVDLVTLFAQDDPLRLIEAIRPDVLVKGADYAPEEVVGGDFVRSYGGRLVLVPLEAGQSTTRTILRIAGGNAAGG